MDINITTKYSIGDEVYVADCYYDYYPQITPYIITDILITVNNKVVVRYRIERDGCSNSVPEEWIFETYAECTKWCEKQNKSL
jgi:hypothetical protein